MAEPAAARQPEPGEDPVAMALRWLRSAVAQRVPGVELRSEVFDRVSLRLARALQRGVRMRSPHAFLATALRQEVAKSKWLRNEFEVYNTGADFYQEAANQAQAEGADAGFVDALRDASEARRKKASAIAAEIDRDC